MRTLTTEQFIEKAKAVHGDRYDYTKVDYKNVKTKVEITCPVHGSFWQRPEAHLRGIGCPRCTCKAPGTTELFIEKARSVHGDKYKYGKVEYKNNKTKVEITCPVHGSFWQMPEGHLRGYGCPKCAGKAPGTTKSFIEKARSVHGDKYKYGKVEYKNVSTRVEIGCPIHGFFWQIPNDHLRGVGCPKCAGVAKLSAREFGDRAIAVHGNRYIYNKVDYKNALRKVEIICPVHGSFWQRPNDHLGGHGCPKCKQSKLELLVESILNDLNIQYEGQYHRQWLGLQSLDFYLPDYNLGIECQGVQHYQPVDHFGGEEGFEDCKKRDALKAQKCKDAGVGLVYIKYGQDADSIRETICAAVTR